MRRKEFDVSEQQEIETFLKGQTFGFLGTTAPDGSSRVTPLNFVYFGDCFYFHGSLAGDKMKHLKHDNRVSFTVAEEYALIPSYFSDPELACPATAFFKSVMSYGRAYPVTESCDKAEALTHFMEKLQPKGGYDPISASDPRYTGNLKAVSVFRLVPDQLTAKFKFGQNQPQEQLKSTLEALTHRNQIHDAETVENMLKYCPYHLE
ncbi:nitroimidazol reductase NimA-like FMN-containing flavoprotein (pyridoxamine 5'-phosphate oxidase superfamily) [Paenibacillus shirakamiensis]|uniref:Nitroimidazol reductase NimA-like FMN-containing flavoprotein (Pyridoxamine 5'-phosphate oxidase superfamily) n=1 Tax=Paenibacillus shirakamiensis TaxID=1265935 RepID=A0ABS4JK75_9BACL|nr:pyridoxamine 5'-phosphate oxidase family protein [Paenibacillus shirakamiensis]MBP2002116.1 nitroimidazol reductase NimA-like FMN-containing flavoprotein (pyridoxamine 5'-phosphate oxidase superfamily) [Paenibacillus shirakamiensis]